MIEPLYHSTCCSVSYFYCFGVSYDHLLHKFQLDIQVDFRCLFKHLFSKVFTLHPYQCLLRWFFMLEWSGPNSSRGSFMQHHLIFWVDMRWDKFLAVAVCLPIIFLADQGNNSADEMREKREERRRNRFRDTLWHHLVDTFSKFGSKLHCSLFT